MSYPDVIVYCHSTTIGIYRVTEDAADSSEIFSSGLGPSTRIGAALIMSPPQNVVRPCGLHR
jgi:hypothetical protein